MRLAILAVGIALLVSSSCRSAPSFDCSKVKLSVEKLICANEELAQLDSKIADAFGLALKSGMSSRAEQRAWLQDRNSDHVFVIDYNSPCNPAMDRGCLAAYMGERLRALTINNALDTDDIVVSGWETKVESIPSDKLQSQIDEFGRSLRYLKMDERIVCERVVSVLVGTENHTRAGDCFLEKNGVKRHVKICNAEMTDAVRIEDFGDREIGSKALGFFAGSNCAGG